MDTRHQKSFKTFPLPSICLVFLVSVFHPLCVNVCEHCGMHVEVRDNLKESIVPSIMWVPGTELESSGLAEGTFTH